MLTSLFRKSTPFNYSLIFISIIVFFFLYHFAKVEGDADFPALMQMAGELLFIFGSFFMVNFIVKKNGLSRDSAFVILFYLMFMLFIAPVFHNLRLLMANLFILLALRRIISLHSPKSIREKIFDASMWIFVASLFHFWCIVYISLVFISILFHVSRDYRNWVLPFLACFSVVSVFGLAALWIDETLIDSVIAGTATDLSIDYFKSSTENIALSAFASVAIFFMISMISTVSGRPLQLQSSYKEIVASFILGVLIFVISPDKSNDILIFTFAPLAFMATAFVEYFYQDKLKVEFVLAVTILSGLTLFFLQL